MFFLSRPTDEAIARFLQRQQESTLSYQPIGLSSLSPAGFSIESHRVVVGHGAEEFQTAKEALTSWQMFELGWAELYPRGASVTEGTSVAVLAHHLGFWSLNGCRVVQRLSEGGTSYGFAYGTLQDHAERGEELFRVELAPVDQSVWYVIRAVSRPRAVLARLGYPISRRLQARFRRDSADALKRAIEKRALGRADERNRVREGP